jgi:predicted nuclease of predicted toxin-antitoxin system
MRFLVDEHIPNAVVRQLQRKYPQVVDVVRASDVGLTGASDPELLAWAAQHERIVITRDKATLTKFAYERMQQGLSMPGVIAITRNLPIGRLLEELALIVELATPQELADRVYYLP